MTSGAHPKLEALKLTFYQFHSRSTFVATNLIRSCKLNLHNTSGSIHGRYNPSGQTGCITVVLGCLIYFIHKMIAQKTYVEGSYRSWDLYTTGQLVDGLQQKKRKPVFIKQKWNHVVFSRATILSFHSVEGSYHSWDLYTTGQLVDGLQQKKKKKKKKENRFSLNGNGIMSSFLGRQFYRSTRYLWLLMLKYFKDHIYNCEGWLNSIFKN